MTRSIGRIKSIIGSALLLLAVAITIIPAQVSAASGNPGYCEGGFAGIDRIDNMNFGTEVPVIMVHGWNGDSKVWGSINNPSSFAGRVNNIPGVAVAHLYNYFTYNWVDNPYSGPKLANTIDCVSQMSLHNGGKGKVIVVAYSMGGLVARDALSHRSYDNERSIADEVGQVVTIGTPHIGTVNPDGPFATGSDSMNNIPHFPPQTIVHTIAGDVTHVYLDRKGNVLKRDQPHDDTLVSTISANAEYTIDVSKGGGEKTINCNKQYRTYFGWLSVDSGPAQCEHTQLIQNAGNAVRGDTIDAIKKYVAWLNTPPVSNSTSLTVGSLTTTYDSRWNNAQYGASGPGQDAIADDTTNTADCTNCETTPPPAVYAFIQITNMDWCTGSMQSCVISDYSVVGAAPAVTIGGKTPSYSARYIDGGYQGTSLVWCFETEKLCVQYRRPVDTPQLEPSAALLDVFSSATWSN